MTRLGDSYVKTAVTTFGQLLETVGSLFIPTLGQAGGLDHPAV